MCDSNFNFFNCHGGRAPRPIGYPVKICLLALTSNETEVEHTSTLGDRKQEDKMALTDYSNHQRHELVSFDDIDYSNFADVEKARDSMLREQWIRTQSLRVTHEALRKCNLYHEQDAQKNCRPLVLKYMKMIESYGVQGYLGYQKNDPSK